jgi:DNA-damage-inducible protein J
MTSTAMLHVRVDEETKQQATETLATLGLSVSDAVRLFLKRVVIEQGLPISLKAPNAETRKALEEAENIMKFRFQHGKELIDDLEENRVAKKGKTTAKK